MFWTFDKPITGTVSVVPNLSVPIWFDLKGANFQNIFLSRPSLLDNCQSSHLMVDLQEYFSVDLAVRRKLTDKMAIIDSIFAV